MKVYLAHPISTTGEFNDSIRVAKLIAELGYDVYAPALNNEINDKSNNPTPKEIYAQDIKKLTEANIIVVNYTGGDSDGTVFELGFVAGIFSTKSHFTGFESNTPVLVYSSNARALQPQIHNGIASGKLNHMVLGAIDEHFTWLDSEQDVIKALQEMKKWSVIKWT